MLKKLYIAIKDVEFQSNNSPEEPVEGFNDIKIKWLFNDTLRDVQRVWTSIFEMCMAQHEVQHQN